MKLSALEPAFITRLPFSRRESAHAPEISGCYALASITEDALYIGQTNSFYRRIHEHLDDPRMRSQTPYGVAVWFYYMAIPVENLDLIEDSLLSKHLFIEGSLPPLNRARP